MRCKENIRDGDLLFIPSNLTLLQFDFEQEVPVRFRTTITTSLGILVEKDITGVYHKVFCEGECWSIPKHLVFPLRRKDDYTISRSV